MRLDVVVRPSPEVMEILARHPRPEAEGLVWSRPEQWVVKLRPLGHVEQRLVPDLIATLEAELDGAPPVRCTLGPETVRKGWLHAPVAGLDELSAVVFEVTEQLVPVTHPQPFVGALALARGKRIPPELGGVPISAAWEATSVELLADRSSPRAPRSEVLAAFPLGG